jgi:putative chitinase
MILTPDSLRKMAPSVDQAKLGTYVGVLNQGTTQFKINTPQRLAFFLGQLLVESDDLTQVREGMFYRTPERLMDVWPKRFPTKESAQPYVGNPQKLANFVYANRMGNGGPETNDGWNHRGAGWFQLTGKTNQETCSKALGIAPDAIGDWLATAIGAAQSACWFWDVNIINRYADVGNIDAVSDAVNLGRQTGKIGDAEGFAKRVARTNLCKQILGVK